jgi:hypothetical protein
LDSALMSATSSIQKQPVAGMACVRLLLERGADMEAKNRVRVFAFFADLYRLSKL